MIEGFGRVFDGTNVTLMYLVRGNFNRDTHWAVVLRYDRDGMGAIVHEGKEIEMGDVIEVAATILREMRVIA